MNKLILAFLVLAFLFAIIQGVFFGNDSYATTTLNDTIAEGSSNFTVYVANTDGFNDVGTFDIEYETLEYNGKTDNTFLHVYHAYNGTAAAAHAAGKMVYSPETSGLNSAMGFNVIGVEGKSGEINIMTFGWNFATKTMPQAIMFDQDFLKVDEMQYLRAFLLILTTGFVFMVTYMIMAAMGGIAQSILNR